MSKPKAICVMGLKCRHVNHRIATGVNEYDHNADLHTAPVYLHEWYKEADRSCKTFREKIAKAKLEGNLITNTTLEIMELMMSSAREHVLMATGYDIATNTITESEGKDETK